MWSADIFCILLSSTVCVRWMDLKSWVLAVGRFTYWTISLAIIPILLNPLYPLFPHNSVDIWLEITFKLSDHKCWHIAIWLPFLQVLKDMNCRIQFENCPFQSLAAMRILIKLVCNIYDRMHVWENLLLMPCIYWSLEVLRI